MLQILVVTLATHRSLVVVDTRRQHRLGTPLLQHVNLLLEVNVYGGEVSVASVCKHCGMHLVAANVSETTCAQGLATSVFQGLRLLFLFLDHGHRYVGVVDLLHAGLGGLLGDGLLRATISCN